MSTMEEIVIANDGMAALRKCVNRQVDITGKFAAENTATVAMDLMAIQGAMLGIASGDYAAHTEAADGAAALALVEAAVGRVQRLAPPKNKGVDIGKDLEDISRLAKKMVEDPVFREANAKRVAAAIDEPPVRRNPFP